MPFHIIRDNLTHVSADAIVNTANPYPLIGSGTDRAVYEAAGKEELLAEREKIGEIAAGDAAVTPAFNLSAKIIIHAVSPVWIDGTHGEIETLSSCYNRALNLALEHRCASIAFPLLGSRSNGFPPDVALKTALDAIQAFLMIHEMEVILVVFDRESFELSSRLYEIREYIAENQVREAEKSEYSHRRYGSRKKDLSIGLVMPSVSREEFDICEETLILPEKEDTFQKRLFQLIDASGKTDPEVYKQANLDRKLFAKIRKDENYRPKRETALALAFALHLSLDEALDLIGRAGYTLSMSTTFDLLIRYCFEHGIYNLYEINTYLFELDQPEL